MHIFDTIKMRYTTESKREAIKKRLMNINEFASLDRTGLSYKSVERKILLHTTRAGEEIFIQYPGKETVSNTPEKVRPWDFRPKLMLPNGESLKDLSFKDIWDDLSNIHASDESALSVMAAIFFRMALMEGYKLTKAEFEFEDIATESKVVLNSGTVTLEFWRPHFSPELYNYLDYVVNSIRGVSVEAFLYYNDLLVLNEDCKYYYRDKIIKGSEWKTNTGRYNTLLTHISVIEYLQGKITFSEIMGRFLSGMGVAPAKMNSIPEITNHIVTR